MNGYTHIIWDFNGTVLDDVQAGISSMNEILAQRGLPILADKAAYREVFGFPVESYYLRVGLDLEKEDFKAVLAPLWVELYKRNSQDAKLYGGVRPLAAALRGRGMRQSILSASHSDMLRDQLAERKALELFDEIWGTDTINAYGKSELACEWRRAHPDDKVLLIGDTTHDFEVAELIGADCVLVADGHHSRQRLLACGCPVVDRLEELADLLPI